MAFEKKTWTDRVSEYPTRRNLIKSDGTSELVTVERSEGSVSMEGDAFDAETMNDLEERVGKAFEEVFRLGSNVKANIVTALQNSGLGITEDSTWEEIYAALANTFPAAVYVFRKGIIRENDTFVPLTYRTYESGATISNITTIGQLYAGVICENHDRRAFAGGMLSKPIDVSNMTRLCATIDNAVIKGQCTYSIGIVKEPVATGNPFYSGSFARITGNTEGASILELDLTAYKAAGNTTGYFVYSVEKETGGWGTSEESEVYISEVWTEGGTSGSGGAEQDQDYIDVILDMYKEGYNLSPIAVTLHLESVNGDAEYGGDNYRMRFVQDEPNSCFIDWGDGTIEMSGEDLSVYKKHIYEGASDSNYTIRLVCAKGMIALGAEDADNYTMEPFFHHTSGEQYSTPSDLYSIELGSVVRTLNENAFRNNWLEKMVLPEGLERIESYALSSAKKSTEIWVPSTVTYIGYANFAFENLYEDDGEIAIVHMASDTPPELYCEEGDSVSISACKIYVPQGCLEAYRAASGWSTIPTDRLLEEG